MSTIPAPLRRLVHRALRRPPPCVLCGGRRVTVGAFVPTPPQAWGLAPGWAGGCVYGLCATCQDRPALADQVEAVLWQHRAQGQAPWN